MSGKSGRSHAKGKPIRRAAAQSLRFTIPSEYAAQRHVQAAIMRAVHDNNYDAESEYAIKLAVEEALINAIKHGNRLSHDKQVKVRASVGPRRTEIVIEDQGEGFDRGNVPDPTAEENICKCHGRGILLIESYMNRVEWTKGGRALKMVRENAGGAARAGE